MITIDDSDDEELLYDLLQTSYVDGQIQRIGTTTFIDLSREDEMIDKEVKQHRTIDAPDVELEQSAIKLREEVEQLRSEVKHLTTLIQEMRIEEKKTTTKPVAKTICVSGQFCVEHRVLAEMIRAKGFSYSETLTLECDYLIVPTLDHKSQKTARAAQYGVSIRDYTFFSDTK